MASTMQGQLEFRAGKGVMGKWEKFDFRLTRDVLTQISLEDQEEIQSFELSAASDLALDTTKRECSLQVGTKKIRLRSQMEDDIRRWHEALAEVGDRHRNAQRSKPPKADGREASSNITQALLAIYNKLDQSKTPTTEFFRKLDTSGDGYLSTAEFRQGLENLGFRFDPEEFKQMVRVLDKDRDGTVGIKELDRILKKAARGEEVLVPEPKECSETSEKQAPRKNAAQGEEATQPLPEGEEEGRRQQTRESILASSTRRVKSVAGHRYTLTAKADMSKASQALLAMFYKLDDAKLRTMDWFRATDLNGDGVLSVSEFRTGLAKLGYKCSDDEFREVMRVLDKDRDGTVSNKELDRALQKVARGEDVLAPVEVEEEGIQAMLQVDTIMNVTVRGDEAQTCYIARARWEGQNKGPKTDSRPSRPSGATTEDCPIRQQLKLVAAVPETVAILSIVRRCQDEPEEPVGSAVIPVTDEKHQEVHVLPLLTEGGQQTGASVRLRVKIKAPKAKATVVEGAKVKKDKASPDEAAEKVDRFQQMYSVHAQNLQKLENKRREDEETERRTLQDEANALKSASTLNAQLNPQEAAERLYRDHAETERRRRARQYQKEAEERRLKAEVRNTRKMHRSFSDATLQTSKEAASRLYEHAVNRREALQKKKEEQEAAEIEEVKNLANKTNKKKSPGASDSAVAGQNRERVEELYNEAGHRRARKEQMRAKSLENERAKLAANAIGKDVKTVNYKRLEELWKEHTDKQQKIATRKSAIQQQEQEKINELIENRRQEREKSMRADLVSPQGKQPPCWQRLYALSQSNDGKGKAANDAKDAPTPKAKSPGSTNVDYILDTMVMALQLRCALVRPPDRKLLAPAMKGLLAEFKDAFTSCNKGEGCTNLASRASQRLFPDGHLLPDFVGWQCVCEPSPIRQVESDLDALMLTAGRAQELLEQMIAPGPLDWKPGELRPKPAAVPMALFAYSNGQKSQESAQTKSMVRYGPAEGPRQYRHLLDLARISLVFASCDLLQAGLDIILGHMEVVDVRNNFRTPPRSGNRFVEILVILEVDRGDGNMMPFVCEIRLEEHNFWQARQRAEPYMQDLCEKVAAHYSAVGRNPDAVGYLSRWLLDTSCESHNLRVFKRHLLRHFGSTIGAWRRVFGNCRMMNFLKFRELCAELKCREHATEYWQELDIGRGGCISLFELDPESLSLLAKFRSRMLALADVSNAEDVDPETLWARLVFTLRPAREGRLEISEFKLAAKPLGFNSEEAMRIFNSLDAEGGHYHCPPAYISKADLAWLRKLSSYGDLDCIFLSNGLAMSESDGLRFVTWSGARGAAKESCRRDQSWSIDGKNGQLINGQSIQLEEQHTLLPPGRPVPGGNGEEEKFFADDVNFVDDEQEPSGVDQHAIEQLRAKEQSFAQQQDAAPAAPAVAFNPPARRATLEKEPTLNLQAPEVQEFTPDDEDDEVDQEDDEEEEEYDDEEEEEPGDTQLPPDLEEETF